MIRRLFTLLLLLTTIVASAQYKVTCKAIDPDGVGEPFATVRIYAAADTVHAKYVNVTEEDGTFSQSLEQSGQYIIKITAVGKVETSRSFAVSSSQSTAQLGDITLPIAANVLKGVEVTAQRPLVKNDIDRLSYDVQGDADSKTNSVLEMLRKVPLVTVDGQDNITVRGSSGYKIYYNGRPAPMLSGDNAKDVLRAIPASMIKRIEVITDPGAKYDAEGVSAILNIVTEDNTNMNGVTGNVTASLDSRGNPGASAYVTSQMGKVVTTVNYGFHHNARHGNKQVFDTWQTFAASLDTLRTNGTSRNSVNVHYGNLEASYEPDTLNLFTAQVGGYYYDALSDMTTATRRIDRTGTPQYSFMMNTHVPSMYYYNINGQLDYQHRTHRVGETITASYMVSSTRKHSDSESRYADALNLPVPYNGTNQRGKESFWEHTGQIDWTRPLSQTLTMETGLKYIYRSNGSHTIMDYLGMNTDLIGVSPNLSVDSRFTHLTQVGAAYFSTTYRKNQWSARAGLRYEWSYLKARYRDGSKPSFHHSLNDWVPSASVSYQIDPANNIKLGFATATQRPGIEYLNPARIESPTSVQYGNPDLVSARNYSITLTYMHIGQKITFNVTPTFAFNNNQISAVNWAEDGRTFSTYRNTQVERYYGLNGFLQWQPRMGTSLMFNGNIGCNDDHSDDLNLKYRRWGTFFFAQLTQFLPGQLMFTANVGQWGGGFTSLYGHSGAMWFHSFGLQRSFLKDGRLTVSINAQNPFSGKYMHYKDYTVQGDYTGVNDYSFTARNFGLRVSYRFGSLNARVKKTDKTIENDDVVGGSSTGGNNAGQQQQGQGM